MPTMANLKGDIDVCRSLGDIIDVIKTAALIQFRIFQTKRPKPREEFNQIARRCFNILLAKQYNHPYLFDRPQLRSAIIVVTSDEGFLGELNTVLVNSAADLIKRPEDELIVLGERGAKYFEDMGVKFTFFPGVTEEMDYHAVETVRDHIIKGYFKDYGRVYIVFPRFVSLVSQKVEKFCLLPVSFEEELPAHISQRLMEDLLIEPGTRSVLEQLVKQWVGFKLLEVFWTSKQSEYGARIMHLEGSTQELTTQKQRLGFDYIRMIHALKDKSIREISASKIMLTKRQ